MLTSSDRIITTHVGSLPRPDDLIELNRAFAAGEMTDEAVLRAPGVRCGRGRSAAARSWNRHCK
jgi:hypothetical protein